ncbi:hypothetical protein GCM10023187_30300 [Nibrella viscosa]|uniref:Outer membrane protein TolC n=1 Tax=Nibrella viscosa TaxID=1084524 RepID=A0ABP8KJV2_9BACT
MKATLVFVSLLFGSVPAVVHAQTPGAQPLRLSLPEAIDLGLKNRLELQNQRLTVQVAENNVRKNRDQWLPAVNGSANFRLNTQLPTTVLPSDFFPSGTSAPQRIRFGTRFNHVLAVDATQNIYNPALRQEVKIAEKNVALEQESLRQVEADVKLNIAEVYYAALLKQEELALAERSVNRAQQYVDVSKAKLQLGTIQENDLKRIQLDYQNADIRRKRVRQELQLRLQQLANALFIDPRQPLALADSLTAEPLVNDLPTDVSALVENRSEIRQSALNNELTRLRVDRAALGLRPTLQAYGNYSAQYQSNKLNLFSDRGWSPFNYVGVQLTVPVFDRNATRRERLEYQLRQQIAQNDLSRQSRAVLDELETVRTELINARLNLQYARENYQLAEEVYQVSQAKYELGSLLYSELLDTEKSLNEAETNLLNSLYDLLVARVRWQKAKGE